MSFDGNILKSGGSWMGQLLLQVKAVLYAAFIKFSSLLFSKILEDR